MIGAIIGDIVGSRFEFDDNNIKTKEFDFFHADCEWTDDSLMTVAEATAVAIWLARLGWKIPEIRAHVVENYYPIDFTLDEIRPTYHMDESCQGSVPQALEAFFESTSFEDAIRNAVSIGGDSDTIAAIAGSVAEAYWGVPKELAAKAESYLEPKMAEVLKKFQLRHYGNIID